MFRLQTCKYFLLPLFSVFLFYFILFYLFYFYFFLLFLKMKICHNLLYISFAKPFVQKLHKHRGGRALTSD